MNFQKIDASLSAALHGKHFTDEPDFIVFIQTTKPLDDEQREELEKLGVMDIPVKSEIFSAQISARAVAEISEKPWVRFISLSEHLRLLD
jgi:hypothetical protein